MVGNYAIYRTTIFVTTLIFRQASFAQVKVTILSVGNKFEEGTLSLIPIIYPFSFSMSIFQIVLASIMEKIYYDLY